MSTKSPRTTKRAAQMPVARSAAKRRPPAKGAHKPALAAPPTPTGSKQSQLIAMLRSPSGGTIDQLAALTGWQPHTVRGTISGALRKRLKLNVTCVDHVYRIAQGPA
jgi:hypothetical protein